MHATPSLRLGDDFILKPVNRRILKPVLKEYNGDPESAKAALPWLNDDVEVSKQLSDFLFELEVHSNTGRIHFWSIHDRSRNNKFVGLVGLGDELQTEHSDWNLGYWVCKGEQRKGIAKLAVNEVFSWLESLNITVVIEITVHPQNIAGLATCKSICEKWAGTRTTPNYWPVDIGNRSIPHVVYYVNLPRGGGATE